MKRFFDIVRLTIISPEVVFALLPFLAITYFPSIFNILLKSMREGIGFGLGAVALPLAMLAFNYKEGLDLLAPTGAKKALLDWPDYPQLKARVIATLFWCVLGAIASMAAVWMVATEIYSQLSAAILVAGILASAVSTATIGLARFTIREIVGE